MTLSYNTHPTQSSRSTDVHSGEHLTCVRFSQSETSLLAASSADRSITLFDARTGSATSRMTMAMRTNQLQFNPMEPTVLLLASEDHNLYTFDIRSFKAATQVYKSHVGAVMSCDWSPTGREFVSGSYDRTVRLWGVGVGKSKDAYHTKRMQRLVSSFAFLSLRNRSKEAIHRVFSIMYTLDSRFVLSGSDDGNLRLWKSRASDKLGILSTREIAKRQYRDTLRDKWGNVGDVAKLERYVFFFRPRYQLTETADNATCPSRSMALRKSRTKCSKPARQRKTTDVPMRRNQSLVHPRGKQSAKRLYCGKSSDYFCFLGYRNASNIRISTSTLSTRITCTDRFCPLTDWISTWNWMPIRFDASRTVPDGSRDYEGSLPVRVGDLGIST